MPLTASSLVEQAHARRAAANVRGRYAPSPSGPLHLGNVRTALIAWLQARLEGGQFVMRMEDLDTERARDAFADGILEDLRWLGLDWDEGPDVGGPAGPYTQSERSAIYDDVIAQLAARGELFECTCTRRELREASSAPHGKTPVYPGTCRHPTPALLAERAGRPASLRWIVPQGAWRVEDEVYGPIAQVLTEEVGDLIVRRADGLYAYQLAVVVDDALMGVTDVVRGYDLLDSAPRQAALYAALGLPTPRFWHVPLMRDEAGNRLSKRDGAESIAALRARGMTPERLCGQLAASLGLCPPDTQISAQGLLQALTPDVFARTLRQQAALDGAAS
jgi:glutamyl-tRNA synthetase